MQQLDRESLVLDNQRLVYHMFDKLSKNQITITHKEDIISEGMVGLVKAANKFDPDKGVKFSTFAGSCIRNEMLMYLRKLNRQVPYEVSLNEPIGYDEDGRELCLGDTIEGESSCIDEVLEVNDFVSKQTPIDKKILTALSQGHTHKEIAAMVGVKQPTVSRHIGKMRKKYQQN